MHIAVRRRSAVRILEVFTVIFLSYEKIFFDVWIKRSSPPITL